MGKKKEYNAEWIDAYMKIRKEWEINPVTRTIPNKKAYTRKQKHKNNFKSWL